MPGINYSKKHELKIPTKEDALGSLSAIHARNKGESELSCANRIGQALHNELKDFIEADPRQISEIASNLLLKIKIAADTARVLCDRGNYDQHGAINNCIQDFSSALDKAVSDVGKFCDNGAELGEQLLLTNLTIQGVINASTVVADKVAYQLRH